MFVEIGEVKVKTALLLLVIFASVAFVMSCSDDPTSPPEEYVPENYRLLVDSRDGLFLRGLRAVRGLHRPTMRGQLRPRLCR